MRIDTKEGFACAYKLHKNLVRSVVFSYEKDTAKVDELVQDVFARAWTFRKNFEHKSAVGTWLYAIARSVAVNHVRDCVDRQPELVTETACGPAEEEYESFLDSVCVEVETPESLNIRDEDYDAALSSLTPTEHDVWASVLSNQTGKASAKELGMSPTTYRWHVMNIKRKLFGS